MAFQNVDEEPGMEEAGPPPEERNNRPFLIAAAILGGIFLLLLLLIAGYVVFWQPRVRAQREARQATAQALNMGTLSAATLTSEAAKFTATFTATRRPTSTKAAPTNTPVVVVPLATNTVQPTSGVAAGTLQALQTTVAAGKALTLTPGALTPGVTATISKAGWADEAGAPTLLVIATLLIVVIFLARRMRTAGT